MAVAKYALEGRRTKVLAAEYRTALPAERILVEEMEKPRRQKVTDIDAEGIADEVEQAVLALDLDDLGSRAGRHQWGYVEPTEAAWEFLEEAVNPFSETMTRHVELGFEAAATATCSGIVLGLHRCRGKNSDQVLGWAADFLAETAGNAVATLARESSAKRRRPWRLPDAIVAQLPEWAEMIKRTLEPTSRRSRRR